MMRAFFFDIDDTLYDLQWPWKMALHDVFDGSYDEIIDRFFRENKKHTDALFPAYSAGRIGRDDYYCLRSERAFADCGVSITRGEALEIYRQYRVYQGQLKMSEEMKNLMRTLSAQGVMTGIVSNSVSDTQWKKIETMQIPAYIPREHIIVSGDVGCEKPDPKIFRLTERRFGLEDAERWYVGDTWQNDIVGAFRAGWHTVWINRRHLEIPQGDVQADYIVEDEPGMIRLISELVSNSG